MSSPMTIRGVRASRFVHVVCVCALAVVLPAAVGRAQQTDRLVYPLENSGRETLEDRAEYQRRTLPRFEVFVDFAFTDRLLESGIDFEHRSVADSLKTWMPVHYDHGNGVAVADVDLDGRYDVYLMSQLGGHGLFRNLGDGRFENITERAGVGLGDKVGVTGSFADIDNDGDPDLFVTSVRTGNTLFLNDGDGTFTDATASSGLGYVGHSSGATFLDYDGDGWLDLFVSNVGVYTTDETGEGGFYRGIDDAFKGHIYPERTETSILYRNLGGGRFEDVSEVTGLVDTSWTGDATQVDFNRDGWPDLYVISMQGDDHYYQNVDGERFVDRTAELFPKTSWGAMGVKFFDYNNDDRMDLIVTDMHSDMHDETVNPLLDEKRKFNLPLADGENNIQGNAFYEQRADGGFDEVSDLVGAENFWPWGVSVGDLNADGWEDVFIASSMNFPFRYAVNTVLINNAGKGFLDSEFILGVEPRRDGRTNKELFELDCPGPDAGLPLCRELAQEDVQGPWTEGAVTVVGDLGTRSAVIFDVDDDGDQDIVTNEFNDVPQVLISDLSERRRVHWLKVELVGSSANRDGLGARVRVFTPSGAYTRYNDGKSGYLSQSSLPLYFGLGDETRIEKVEVVWPGGQRQTVTEGLGVDRSLEIRQPTEG